MSVKIALAGNPNSGKTTLFNALTGSNQFVGNWPGVTVEKKEGKLKGYNDVTIMDLPGIYSLSPYTLEEVVARNYLINNRPDVILNIVDGTNIERNLYLTTQLAELGIPVLVAVNMMDAVDKSGAKIDLDKLSEAIGCDVVSISALKNKGVKEAAQRAVRLANKKDFKPVHKFSDTVEQILSNIESMLDSSVPENQKRFFAVKLFERDEKIADTLKNIPDISEIIESAENMLDDDSESIITNERYNYISSIIKSCYTKRKAKTSASDKIDKVVTNRWLALPIFAVVMFLVYYISVTTVGTWGTDWVNDNLFGDGFHLFGIGQSAYEEASVDFAKENIWTDEVMAILESAAEREEADIENGAENSEKLIGAGEILEAAQEEDFGAFEEGYGSYGEMLSEKGFDISELIDEQLEEAPDPADYGVWVPGIPAVIEGALNALGTAEWLNSLILDGIVAGVGAVLGFLPQMMVLFIFLAILEACGYMARIAFIMDRIFRKFGLSGKSFIPMLIGTGCGVPGIMASRTIENDRDRKMTIMTTTFIPCGAKLPIIALISGALFGGAWWVAPSAYFMGIAAIILSGIILKKTKMFAGEPAPFVMELPAYHVPTVGNVLRSMWERAWSFIKKAGTIILLSSIVIWAGKVFGVVDGKLVFDVEMELSDSLLGIFGNAIKWIFAPLGFGDATAAVATIMGLVAKEEVVGVFGVLDFVAMTRIAAYSFLAFNLLCAPCFAAIGAIRREMNSAKWTWFAIGYQCIFAYIVSLCIFRLGTMFAGGGFGLWTVVSIVLVIAAVYLLVRPYKESGKLDINTKSLGA